MRTTSWKEVQFPLIEEGTPEIGKQILYCLLGYSIAPKETLTVWSFSVVL